MNAMRLAAFVLWALAIVASVLGMGVRENSVAQDWLFGFAVVAGAAGLITLIGSV